MKVTLLSREEIRREVIEIKVEGDEYDTFYARHEEEDGTVRWFEDDFELSLHFDNEMFYQLEGYLQALIDDNFMVGHFIEVEG